MLSLNEAIEVLGVPRRAWITNGPTSDSLVEQSNLDASNAASKYIAHMLRSKINSLIVL